MTSYGQTMIIDRCQSGHRFNTNNGGVAWNSPSSSVRQPDATEGTVGLDHEEEYADDEERQMATAAAAAAAAVASNGGSYQILNMPLFPNTKTPLPAKQPQEYGSIRQRGTSNSNLTQQHQAKESIRFQVVVWDVGPVDVVLGRVPMTFRVTMFWNDIEQKMEETGTENSSNDTEDSNATSSNSKKAESHTEWQMQGRRKAYERVVNDDGIVKAIDVPPLSLLNVVTFNVIGQPEVCVLREQERVKGTVRQKRRLMRWTCLYQATLLQDTMRVDNFPHDEHVLSLKLGILVHRRPGSRWDMNKYRLDLATEDDSQGSTRVPHGVIVDHVRVPNFTYDEAGGLDFQFAPLSFGTMPLQVQNSGTKQLQDQCLKVRLRVKRDSGYYDKNIFPLIFLLNVVGVCIPMSLESDTFFQRGLLLLNITFVQIGIRTNIDKHLPSVGYQIKLQRIMNQFFFSLLLIVLESSLVYVLHFQYGWTLQQTHHVDDMASFLAWGHIVFSWVYYYRDSFPMMPLSQRPCFDGSSKKSVAE